MTAPSPLRNLPTVRAPTVPRRHRREWRAMLRCRQERRALRRVHRRVAG